MEVFYGAPAKQSGCLCSGAGRCHCVGTLFQSDPALVRARKRRSRGPVHPCNGAYPSGLAPPDHGTDRLERSSRWGSIGAGRCHHAGLFPVGRVHAQRQPPAGGRLLLLHAPALDGGELPLSQSVAQPQAMDWMPAAGIRLAYDLAFRIRPTGSCHSRRNWGGPFAVIEIILLRACWARVKTCSDHRQMLQSLSQQQDGKDPWQHSKDAHHHPLRPTGQQVAGPSGL